MVENLNLHEKIPKLFSYFKNKSFEERNKFLANKTKDYFISVGKAIGYCEPETDWFVIAEKCSTNINHEHYGKSPEKILEIWNTKKQSGSKRGYNLEDYIRLKLNYDDDGCKNFLTENAHDENLIGKCSSFDKMFSSNISKIDHVGSELWLVCSELGTSIRLDDLFVNLKNGRFFIFDWKNNDNLSYDNRFKKYIGGGMLGMDACDAHKFNFQVFAYRYILQKYLNDLPNDLIEFKDFGIFTFVINLTKTDAIVVKPKTELLYSKTIIEETYKFARIKHEEILEERKQKTKTKIDAMTFDKVDLKNDDLVICINGYARSGKDTTCDIFSKLLSTTYGVSHDYVNVSSITPIVKAMELLGYDGVKTDKSRKMMSEIKKLSVEYNDYPTSYVFNQITKEKIEQKPRVSFCHIREWDEINKLGDELKQISNTRFLTLFVDRPNVDIVNNSSDNSVSTYADLYNMHIFNDGSLSDLEIKVKDLIEKSIEL